MDRGVPAGRGHADRLENADSTAAAKNAVTARYPHCARTCSGKRLADGAIPPAREQPHPGPGRALRGALPLLLEDEPDRDAAGADPPDRPAHRQRALVPCGAAPPVSRGGFGGTKYTMCHLTESELCRTRYANSRDWTSVPSRPRSRPTETAPI